jgi:hypothetical protein
MRERSCGRVGHDSDGGGFAAVPRFSNPMVSSSITGGLLVKQGVRCNILVSYHIWRMAFEFAKMLTYSLPTRFSLVALILPLCRCLGHTRDLLFSPASRSCSCPFDKWEIHASPHDSLILLRPIRHKVKPRLRALSIPVSPPESDRRASLYSPWQWSANPSPRDTVIVSFYGE